MSANKDPKTSKNNKRHLNPCEKEEKALNKYSPLNSDLIFVCNTEDNIVYIHRKQKHDEIIENNANETAKNTLIIKEAKAIDFEARKYDFDDENKYPATEKNLEELRKHEREVDEGRILDLSIGRARKRTSKRNEVNNTPKKKKAYIINECKRLRNNISNNNIHNLDNEKSKRQPFIYDIQLEISFDGEQLRYMTAVIRSTIDIIIGNIIHKYRPWRIAFRIIAMDLFVKLVDAYLDAKSPSYKWGTTVHISGYYHGDEEQININEHLPVVYDRLSYIGYLTPKKSKYILNPETYSMIFNYTINFFLSPAVEIAKSFYETRGFEFKMLTPYPKRKFAFENYDSMANNEIYDYKQMYTDSLALMFIDEQRSRQQENSNR